MNTRRTLQDAFPALAAQWHPSKNTRSPSDVSPGSNDKAWWLCPVDPRHEWQAAIGSRSGGVGCPICANRLIVPGLNDLATTHPELASQWHPTLNARSPSEVSAGSNAEYHWVCSANPQHVWEARVKNRAKMGVGCPFCSGKRTLRSQNSLAAVRPEVAAEWHPLLNDFSAADVTPRSGRMAWWLCAKNNKHVWQATVSNRTAMRGTGCPYCSNRKILPGENSLAVVFPELVAEWHPANTVAPSEVAPYSNAPVRWVCALGHEWEASPRQRHTRGCAVCSNQRVLPGFNDVATTHSHLLNEWADEDVLPDTVIAGTRTKVFWRCSAKGHEWRSPLQYRTRSVPTGCPECNASTFSSRFEKDIADFVQGLLPDETVERTCRGLIQNGRFNELDIYIPSLNIAIECNGVYWHSEGAGKDRNFHKAKLDACRAAGIQLIQIWEDDWAERQDVVKSMLAHKLGASQARMVYARQTDAVDITATEARVFLNAHHIQGAITGSFYLGLRERGTAELVAVMVLKRQGGKASSVLRLERYATSLRLPGGHSKLVSYAERHIEDWTELVTFADLEVSDGSLYEATGWVQDAVLRPDYRYVVGNTRRHKFGYRLARFRDDPDLEYEPGLTERELASLNKLHRVWDSGKIRFKYLRA